MNKDPRNIADALKEARKELCLTQQELANTLQIPYHTYRGWERGDSCVSAPILLQLLGYMLRDPKLRRDLAKAA